jgi:hypothetical protein
MTCSHCGQDPVNGCDGRGYVLVDAERNITKECPRLYVRRLSAHLVAQMGAEILKVKHVKNSPLYVLGKPGEPVIEDLTQQNRIIRNTSYGAFLAHLKWALVCRGLTFRCKIVTDRDLVHVYVGNTAYKSRPVGKRDDMEIYNQLEDYVGGNWDLVVIRLGQLGHKNKAAPGVLKESLMLRDNLNRTTWLVEDPDNSWSASRDDAVEEYVRKHFVSLTLDDADPGIEIRGQIVYDNDDTLDDILKNAPSDKKTTKSTPKEEITEIELPGDDEHNKPKWKYNSKRFRGGGPV